ncbi:PadR family transcriptional regulator [Alkanindiges sp. WGS2144]|uniref:PadR family transcriptional regulator n=1 Tax=Alkanindiges sp. WGS2144 TaxID=3366808 RepID=UPI00375140FA
MSLSHVLLTSLLEKPSSGYDLARRFDKSMGFFWNATHQQIYRELKRMENQGWINSQPAKDAGKTKKKTYHVLETGKAELKRWAGQQTDPYIIREELAVRLRAEAILGSNVLQAELQRHLQLHEEKLALYLSIEQRDFIKQQPLSREQKIQHQVLILGIQTQKTLIDWVKDTIALFDELEKTE